LATNLLHAERDVDLSPAARERIAAFRTRRSRWLDWLRAAAPADAAAAIVTDGGLYAARKGETAAAERLRATMLDRFIGVLRDYAQRHPLASLHDALSYCERIAAAECGPEIDDRRDDAVVVASVDRILARRFDEVFLCDVRAGAFPPYYVPDAFLFSPTWGMIPKESAGDAPAARTAKFSWYEHTANPRAAFVREQRRLFAAAMGRADRAVTITASGKPTRGKAAPELAVEVERLLTSVSSESHRETPNDR
jgi:superfamily I DNA/RNA helicase